MAVKVKQWEICSKCHEAPFIEGCCQDIGKTPPLAVMKDIPQGYPKQPSGCCHRTVVVRCLDCPFRESK